MVMPECPSKEAVAHQCIQAVLDHAPKPQLPQRLGRRPCGGYALETIMPEALQRAVCR